MDWKRVDVFQMETQRENVEMLMQHLERARRGGQGLGLGARVFCSSTWEQAVVSSRLGEPAQGGDGSIVIVKCQTDLNRSRGEIHEDWTEWLSNSTRGSKADR